MPLRWPLKSACTTLLTLLAVLPRVRCAIRSASSSAHIFHTTYIDTNYDIHDQLLVQLRYMAFQMDPQLVFDSACCGIDEGYLCAGYP